MATYNSFDSLSGKVLEYHDEVIFNEQIKYSVCHDFLSNTINMVNDKIFSFLKLDKEVFCSQTYGYQCGNGSWPVCNVGDMDALTRCVLELFRILEAKYSPKQPKEYVSKRIFLRR